MNEWALMHRGRIVNVVMTSMSKDQVQEHHPTYHVQALDTVPDDVLEQYQYWRDRP